VHTGKLMGAEEFVKAGHRSPLRLRGLASALAWALLSARLAGGFGSMNTDVCKPSTVYMTQFP
jgi:hypothetical protein